MNEEVLRRSFEEVIQKVQQGVSPERAVIEVVMYVLSNRLLMLTPAQRQVSYTDYVFLVNLTAY